MKHQKYVQALALPSASLGIRALIIAGAVAALAVGLLALVWSGSVWAQEESACDVNDLGTLGTEAGMELTANGRWTTEDCDSRFRAASDAHTYRFEVIEGGRIRIDLISEEGDSFLYLMAEDERRLADNDDGGAGLDARVERDLTPGIYLDGGNHGRRSQPRSRPTSPCPSSTSRVVSRSIWARWSPAAT